MDAAAITTWAKVAKETAPLRTPAIQQARDRLIEQHRIRPIRIEQPTYLPAKIAYPPGVASAAEQIRDHLRALGGVPTVSDGLAATMQARFRAQSPTPRIGDLVAKRMQRRAGAGIIPLISDLLAEQGRQQGIGVLPRISDLVSAQMQASADTAPRLDYLASRAAVSPAQPLDAVPVDPEAVRILIRQRLEELISETLDRLTRARHTAGRISILSRLQELRFLWVVLTFYFLVGSDSPISPVVTTSVQLGFEAAGLIEKRRES